jgi:hypothetical protein
MEKILMAGNFSSDMFDFRLTAPTERHIIKNTAWIRDHASILFQHHERATFRRCRWIAAAGSGSLQDRERSLAIASTMSGKSVGQVITWSAVELHPFAVLARDDAEPVVLDFAQPLYARRRLRGIDGEARRNEPSRRACGRGSMDPRIGNDS